MSMEAILIVMLVVFFASMLAGVHIFNTLLLACVIALLVAPGLPLTGQTVFRSMVATLDNIPFLAIPLFIFSGYIMARGGLAQRLFDLFGYFFAAKTAGLPMVVAATCFMYGSFIGSAPSTVAAVGVMAVPLLIKFGYDKYFSICLVTVASCVAIILPPSTPMIVYGMASGVSIGDMFISGIIPGIVVFAFLMVFCYLRFKIRGGENKEMLAAYQKDLRTQGFLKVFKGSIFAILSPLFVLGGIYGGIVTPTEAAVIAVIYALLVCMVIYRTIKLKELLSIIVQASITTAIGLPIVATASTFGRVLTFIGAPQRISEGLVGLAGGSDIGIILLIFAFLLIFGMIMDPNAVILICTPIFFPIAMTQLGMHPIHFGMLIIMCSAIGFVTPPVGMSLFVASAITDLPAMSIGRRALPFVGVLFIVSVIILFVPILSTVFVR